MKSNCKNCEVEFEYLPSQKNGIYCSNKCQGEYLIKQRFTKGVKFKQTMRKYLIEHSTYKCSICGISEWNGKEITLQVDHIDGDNQNNTFENLRFVCPNCHTQTDTWGVNNISEEGRKRLSTNKKIHE
jgi:hypothetical protein